MSSNHPRVSIIIDNYNYGRFLSCAIDSALAQTYKDTEIIVVDDGSTDDSRRVIAGYSDRIAPVLKSNGGMASAFNAGFARSRGDFILFLDADDYLLPEAISRAVPAFDRENVVKVHWQLRVVDADGHDTGRLLPDRVPIDGDLRDEFIARGPISVPQPPTSGNIWTRWFLERVMPLREHDDRHGAEGALRKLAPVFGTVRRIDQPLSCYRIHGDNYAGARDMIFRFRRSLRRIPHYCELLAEHLAAQGLTVDPTCWMGPGSEYDWIRRVISLHEQVEQLIAHGATILLIDDDMAGQACFPRHRILPFVEHGGEYWGPPEGDRHALRELERMIKQGVNAIVIAFSAYWWLEEFPQLAACLRESFPCVADDESLIAFQVTCDTPQFGEERQSRAIAPSR